MGGQKIRYRKWVLSMTRELLRAFTLSQTRLKEESLDATYRRSSFN